jgi:hypothetical protein
MKRQKYNWNVIISDWEKSGISQAKYCKLKNLNQNLFSKWKIKLGDQEGINFVEVKLSEQKTEQGLYIQIDKCTIKVNPDFNKDLLKEVLEIIGEVGC